MTKEKKLVEELEAKREVVSAAITQLTEQGRQHLLGATTGNKADRRALDLLAEDKIRATRDYSEIEAALVVARENVVAAEQQASSANADRQYKIAREISDRIATRAGAIDEALRAIADEARAIAEDLKALSRTGAVNSSMASRLLSQGNFGRAASRANVASMFGVDARNHQAESFKEAAAKTLAVAIKRPVNNAKPHGVAITARQKESAQFALTA